jgi:general secretion pathway protein E
MGVADYLITATLNGVVAQRLVRRLCATCREPYKPPIELVRRLPLQLRNEPPKELFHSVGCPACRKGFEGRLAVAEVMIMTDRLRKAVLDRAAAHDIRKIAIEEGMRSLVEDGMDKARLGLTSIEEVLALTHAVCHASLCLQGLRLHRILD